MLKAYLLATSSRLAISVGSPPMQRNSWVIVMASSAAALGMRLVK